MEILGCSFEWAYSEVTSQANYIKPGYKDGNCKFTVGFFLVQLSYGGDFQAFLALWGCEISLSHAYII